MANNSYKPLKSDSETILERLGDIKRKQDGILDNSKQFYKVYCRRAMITFQREFNKNPSAVNFGNLEKAMLSYQYIYQVVSREQQEKLGTKNA